MSQVWADHFMVGGIKRLEELQRLEALTGGLGKQQQLQKTTP